MKAAIINTEPYHNVKIKHHTPLLRGMKKQRSGHAPSKVAPSMNEIVISSEERLGRFFNLLFQIDKRKHPELYESQKSRNCPDQTTRRAASLR